MSRTCVVIGDIEGKLDMLRATVNSIDLPGMMSAAGGS
jgi:hypothetical protein